MPDYTLDAAEGSAALTGQAAALLAARYLTAGAGAFSLTGHDAADSLARIVNAGAGAFAAVGEPLALPLGRRFDATAGLFNASGRSAALRYRTVPRGRISWWTTSAVEQQVYSGPVSDEIGRLAWHAGASRSYWVLASVVYTTGVPSATVTFALEDDTDPDVDAVRLHTMRDNARVVEDASGRVLLIGRVDTTGSGGRSVRVTAGHSAGLPITIKHCALTVLLAREGDRYAAADTVLSNATTTLAVQSELAWTAGFEGETYLVVASAAMRSSAGNRALVDLWDGATSRGNADTRYRTGVLQSCAWAEAFRAQLAGDQTFQIRGATQQLGSETQVQDGRLLALLVESTETSFGIEDRAKSATSSAQASTKAEVTGAAAQAPYLVLGRASVDVADAGGLIEVGMTADGVDLSAPSLLAPPAVTRPPSPNFDTVAAFMAVDRVPAPGDRTWALRYASPAGGGLVGIYGASIAVLELLSGASEAGAYQLSGQDVTFRFGQAVAGGTLGGYLFDVGADNLVFQDGTLIAMLPGTGPSFVMTGQDVAMPRTLAILAAEGLSYVEGQDAALLVGRRLELEAAGFVLTGRALALAVARMVGGQAGSFLLSGQDAALLSERLIALGAGSYAVQGQDASIARGYLLAAGAAAFPLSGQDLALPVERRIEASAGSLAATGQDLALPVDRLLSAGAGAFATAGQDLDLARGLVFGLAAGSFATTGQAAAMPVGRRIDTQPGAGSLTGQDLGLVLDRLLTAGAGAGSLAGQDLTLSRGLLLVAEAGAYAVQGQDIDLIRGLGLSAGAGAFATQGQDATLVVVRRLVADAGAGATTGQDASLLARRLLPAEAGAGALAGQDAALVVARRVDAQPGSAALTGAGSRPLAHRLLRADHFAGYLLDVEDSPILDQEGMPIPLAPGAGPTFTARGQSILFQRGLSIVGGAGAFVWSGGDAVPVLTRRLVAEAGAFVFTGQQMPRTFLEVPVSHLRGSLRLTARLRGSTGLTAHLRGTFRLTRELRGGI